RIVVIPSLWGANGIHPNFWHVTNVIATSARERGLEVIWHAWEWLIGFPELMADTVHPNAGGYARFVQYIQKYFRGESTAVNYGGSISLASGLTVHGSGVNTVSCVD